ncbi:MAG TPA: hypothetical protein VMC84_01480 [Methanocella sp.]|uniref:hypothetical protein n=1 Tax=Methanocella sp. TaxID=2052833 RepID=UPI002C52BEBB|nr:hypothetical protein [Methanocella sp.]HTY89825.1 hypothetical protein [Methanocella sp.]
MINKKAILILIAVMIVAVTLADSGCVGALRSYIESIAPSITTTPTPASPTPLPAPTTTATPLPKPTAPVHIDLIYTAPLESGIDSNASGVHVLTGNITYNGVPASGFEVLVDTRGGFEYGNKTDSKGKFIVGFHDDWSPTYYLKVADEKNVIIYSDKAPHPVNQTGPFWIQFEVPETKQISVTITP